MNKRSTRSRLAAVAIAIAAFGGGSVAMGTAAFAQAVPPPPPNSGPDKPAGPCTNGQVKINRDADWQCVGGDWVQWDTLRDKPVQGPTQTAHPAGKGGHGYGPSRIHSLPKQ